MFNQITEWFSVNDLAQRVQRVGNAMGLNVEMQQLSNPRVELEEHYYNVVHTKLLDLGLQPHLLNDAEVEHLIGVALQHRDRVNPRLIAPTVNWRETENQVAQTPEPVSPAT